MRIRVFNRIILVMGLISVITNSIFFFSAKDTVVDTRQEHIKIIGNIVKKSLEAQHNGLEIYETALARRLRSSSLSIQRTLPSNANDVTTEQLQALSKELNLDGISLIVKEKGYYKVAQSDKFDQEGKLSDNWGKNWNRMLSQLFEDKNVTVESNFGQSLNHFWASPEDNSIFYPEKVFRWGYYHDGSTNYIIETWLSNKVTDDFENVAGVDGLIDGIIKENNFIHELSVVNYEKLIEVDEKQDAEIFTNSVFHVNRLVVNGTYKYRAEDDKIFAKEAENNNQELHKVVEINGKKILKSYIPIQLSINGNYDNDPLLLIVSSDYEEISGELRERLIKLSLVGVLCVFFSILIGFGLYRYVRKQGKLMSEVQSLYTENIERLFNTLKEYRHDFNHHIFTLQGLISLKKYDDVSAYLETITKVHVDTSDFININIPAFGGLLQTKIAVGQKNHIQFEHHFEGFDAVNISIEKTTNLVRVIGNILDNAFHAVMENEETNRKVTILGKVKDGKMCFRIYNNGKPIPYDQQKKIFESGFTTKRDRGGSGIGLSSSKKIVESYKGTLEVKSNDEITVFFIEIPLTTREFIQVK